SCSPLLPYTTLFRSEAARYPPVEIPEALPSRSALPHLVDRPVLRGGEELFDFVGRAPVPFRRVAYLSQPIHDLRLDAGGFDEGLSGLLCPHHGRDPDLVDVPFGDPFGEQHGLIPPSLGEGRVAPRTAVYHVGRFRVPHQGEPHIEKGNEERVMACRALGGHSGTRIARL